MCKFEQKLFKAASSCMGEMKVDICLVTHTCTQIHLRACGARTKSRQRARGCNINSSDRCVNNNWTKGTLSQISVTSTINLQIPDKSELYLP